MEKKRENWIIERFKQPSTIWKIAIFIFWLWATRSSLNYRISRLEEFQETVDVVEIKTTLAQIQSDLNRIKQTLSNYEK